MLSNNIVRFARPTDNLEEIKRMYMDGLGFKLLFQFEDHDGFDGVILGYQNQPQYHLEFTHHIGTSVGKAPSKDHLIAFYVPNSVQYNQQCDKLLNAGFKKVTSYNPYWDKSGSTFEDIDGYRIVLTNIAFDDNH